MNLKTYQAYSMSQALNAVKDDLGPDAVILNTRSFKRGGVLGIGRKTIIEVTATPARSGANVLNSPSQKTPNLKSVPAQKAYSNPTASAIPPAKRAALSTKEQDRQRAQLLAQILLEQQKRYAAVSTNASTHKPAVPSGGDSAPPSRLVPALHPHTVSAALDVSSGPADGANCQSIPIVAEPVPASSEPPEAARRFVLQPSSPQPQITAAVRTTSPVAGATALSDVRIGHSASGSASHHRAPVEIFAEPRPALEGLAPQQPSVGSNMHAMQDELQAIKSMVGQVLQRQSNGKAAAIAAGYAAVPATMPQHLFDMYLKMIGHDLSDEIADQIVNDVRDELPGMDLEDPDKVRDAVLRHLADFIPVAAQPVEAIPEDGRPLIVALVGPTGVGKTTTLAKLAASFKLRHKKRVGLITADTYRIAAVDQLRTYANIIGLPLQVALSPHDMANAVRALSSCEVILIDTAGRSQNDHHRIDELKAFIAAANPHEVHMVLSSTAGEKVLLREAEAFSAIGVQKIVLTKLDEAVSFGVLVNVVRKLGKQLSFFTTGQEVPDHIEVSRPDRLAKLVLEGAITRE